MKSEIETTRSTVLSLIEPLIIIVMGGFILFNRYGYTYSYNANEHTNIKLIMKKGFTLIELMAVIVILGILATVVAVNVSPFLQRANLEKVRADISQIEKALELYKFNELTYPTTDQGIQSLVVPPSDLKRPSLYPEGGYIKSFPQDPWGREYLYLYPGLKTHPMMSTL